MKLRTLAYIVVASLIALVRTEVSWAYADFCWPASPSPNAVFVYDGANFDGACAILQDGDKFPDLGSIGWNDRISSIKVGSGVRAVLYQHANFGERKAHYEGGFDYELGTDNNKTSSIEVFSNNGQPAAVYYLGTYPKNRENFWSHEAQGIAHSDAQKSWYISQNKVHSPYGTQIPRILKIPYTSDLNQSGRPTEAHQVWLQDVIAGYDHVGDVDVANLGGVEYVFIPIDGGGQRPRILVLRADTLECVVHDEVYSFGSNSVGWVAISAGRLYTSESTIDSTHPIHVFPIDTSVLSQGGCVERWFLGDVEALALSKRDGSAVDLRSMQGGTFSPTGALLYLSNGYSSPVGGDDEGVRVFQVSNGVLQAESTTATNYGSFVYEFHSGWPNYQEPEGLDFVDATGKNMPGISGQLHIIMLQNESSYPDAVYFKHYEF